MIKIDYMGRWGPKKIPTFIMEYFNSPLSQNHAQVNFEKNSIPDQLFQVPQVKMLSWKDVLAFKYIF